MSGDFQQGFRYGAFYGSYRFVQGSQFAGAPQLAAELAAASERMAIILQQDVARALRQSIVRRSASTGVLEQVLLDRRNRASDEEGFGVGIPEYLDDSAAKYWRQIDKGSEAHLGKELQGVWGSTEYRGPDYHRGFPESQRALVGQAFGFGERGGQGFVPFGRKTAYQLLKGDRPGRAKARRPSGKGVIQNPIKAEEYFKRGWESFGRIERLIREYDKVLRAAGFKVVWHQGQRSVVPLRGIRAAQRRAIRGL